MIQWSDDPLDQMLKSNWYPEAVTHRELKESLYYDIISYFDKGKVSTMTSYHTLTRARSVLWHHIILWQGQGQYYDIISYFDKGKVSTMTSYHTLTRARSVLWHHIILWQGQGQYYDIISYFDKGKVSTATSYHTLTRARSVLRYHIILWQGQGQYCDIISYFDKGKVSHASVLKARKDNGCWKYIAYWFIMFWHKVKQLVTLYCSNCLMTSLLVLFIIVVSCLAIVQCS